MTAPVLTAAQVAARLHRPERNIRYWCKRGVFPGAFQVGRRWVIPLVDVLLREGIPNGNPPAPVTRQAQDIEGLYLASLESRMMRARACADEARQRAQEFEAEARAAEAELKAVTKGAPITSIERIRTP